MTPRELYLSACIPTRLALALLPLALTPTQRNFMMWPVLLIGIGFMTLYITNSRLSAFEAGGTTWWANLRIVHAILYLIAAFMLYRGLKSAWIPLVIDVCVGLYISYLHYNIPR